MRFILCPFAAYAIRSGTNMTEIFANQNIKCPFSATIEMIERLHHTGVEHVVGPFSGVRTPVVCDLAEVRDFTDDTRIHEALNIHWSARPGMPLLEMDGLLTVRPNGPMTELRMEGRYEPPLGIGGRLFDNLFGRYIARRTIRRFLRELRGFIEAEWEKERHTYGARTKEA